MMKAKAFSRVKRERATTLTNKQAKKLALLSILKDRLQANYCLSNLSFCAFYTS